MTKSRRGRCALVGLVFALFVAPVACTDDASNTADSTVATTAPETTKPSAPPMVDVELPTVTEPADVPGYNIYRPADLDAIDGPLPVIVWANGGCVRYDAAWAPILDRWAAAGFVVVALTALPGVEVSLDHPTNVEDQAGAIDWAQQANQQDGPYQGRLDLDRVVAAGNSCGGITALNLASTDDRVAAVFVLSGSSAFPGAPRETAAAVIDKITVPFGFAVGGPEDISRVNAQQDFDLAVTVPAFLAARATADHPTVSTDPGIAAEVAEIGINWMDYALNGNEAARRALETNPCGECDPGLWAVQSKNLG